MTATLSERVVVNDLRNEGGYAPELKRTLSSFQMFAISFASVSVVIGVFATYSDVLQNSGPVGIWLFPVVAVGQILVALVYAQFAARIPLSGSSYQWASRLANPKLGNMAEEAKDAHRTVPRAIVGSVVVAAILGMLLIIALTVAIRDMGAASHSDSPVAEIMNQQFGPGLERPLLLVIAIAFFGAALVTMAATSRIVFAMARDERFPAHRMFKKVNPHTQTPIPATLLVLAIGDRKSVV